MKQMILVLLLLLLGTGCSTLKQTSACARTDFRNFLKTIHYNHKQKGVYSRNTFTPTYQPSYHPDYL